MHGSDFFWFWMGALAASAAAFVVPLLWRSFGNTQRWIRHASVGAFALAFMAASLWLYVQLGEPSLASAADNSHAASPARNPQRTTASLDEAMRTLALRLQQNDGSDADWELLAQSYEYSGNASAAATARAHRVAANLASSSPKATAQDKDVRSWLAAAQAARRERRLADARTAFEKVIELHGMSADGWADYADVLASISGSLRGAPAQAIDKALAADSRHRKALWLEASLALEENRGRDALATWKRLRTLIADGSPDARIIDANIAEAAELAKTRTAATTPAGIAIQGQVALSPDVAARVVNGMTLFVYAKAVDQSGPPLAVWRSQVGRWPIRFKLDDSLAMMPDRRLSAFDRVRIEARLSASGEALAKPGDLQASSSIVATRNAPNLTLTLSHVID